jgi:hypothetical protein
MKNSFMKIAALTIVAAGMASATCADGNVWQVLNTRVGSIGVNQNANVNITPVAAPGQTAQIQNVNTSPWGPLTAWTPKQLWVSSGATSYGGTSNVGRVGQQSLLQQAFQLGSNLTSITFCNWKEVPGSFEIINVTVGN